MHSIHPSNQIHVQSIEASTRSNPSIKSFLYSFIYSLMQLVYLFIGFDVIVVVRLAVVPITNASPLQMKITILNIA